MHCAGSRRQSPVRGGPVRRSTIVPCLALALASAACVAGPTPARPSASLAAATMAPPVAPQPVASGGSLAVGTFVRSREPQLQFCYGETRAASPALAGSATVAVTLAADGRVLKADVVRRSWAGGSGAET